MRTHSWDAVEPAFKLRLGLLKSVSIYLLLLLLLLSRFGCVRLCATP